ncbi:hypothetical protein LptCag_2748 [Leptospirillum ferriphilum]|uniref:Uncharacterized protein n=1 Tax=Leptospirillum ferriphilum TaxID=178606 RepID=A0A094WAL9_9BACT|nr:hypothetical protein LptCag_2748 [Leptospirillum ferriphilum]
MDRARDFMSEWDIPIIAATQAMAQPVLSIRTTGFIGISSRNKPVPSLSSRQPGPSHSSIP